MIKGEEDHKEKSARRDKRDLKETSGLRVTKAKKVKADFRVKEELVVRRVILALE